jgi:hypothetical protein
MARRSAHRDARSAQRALVLGSTVALALVAAGGPASAFWSTHGQGSGSAATEALVDVSLSPGAPEAQLYPGGSSDVVVAFTNTNAATVHIGSLALDADQGAGGFSADAGHAACDLSALTFTTATNSLAGWAVPGADGGTAGTGTATLSGALSMGLDAADECQGAIVTVHLSAGP